jgi:uncharacterized protein
VSTGRQAPAADKQGVRRLLIASGIVGVSVTLFAALPAPDGYVNDFASVLDEADESYLETFLERLERDTTAEVVVATVASLEGMTVEDYANRLFSEWSIGQARQDNGVLLLVAPGERTVRIEVGYGLEPILPDGLTGEIIRTEILPEFRAGNLPRGIGRGLNRLAQIVRRDPEASARAASAAGANDRPPLWFVIPFVATFVVFGSFAAGLGLRTKTYAPLAAGGLFVGIPLLLAVAVSWTSIAILLPFGLAALALGYRRGISAYWMSMLRKGTPDTVTDYEPDGWVAGGTPGSSSGGSSDSGGASSSGGDFGGGSSGGGGASGRW